MPAATSTVRSLHDRLLHRHCNRLHDAHLVLCSSVVLEPPIINVLPEDDILKDLRAVHAQWVNEARKFHNQQGRLV